MRYPFLKARVRKEYINILQEVNRRSNEEGKDFSFRSIKIPRSSITDDGVICPFCNTIQKRLMSHIKKVHEEDHNEALETEFRMYMSNLRQEKSREAKKKRDPIGFAQSRREEQQKSRVTKKECDPLGFSATREKELIRMQERQKKAREEEKKRDAEKFAEGRRKEQERHRACKMLKNPELYAEREKEQKAKQRQKEKEDPWANACKKFTKENQLGPVFPCACCHTYKFREQVVELSPKQAAKIEKCAYEAFMKEQAAKKGRSNKVNQMTREEMEEENRRGYEEFLRNKNKGRNQEDSEPEELTDSESDLEEEVNLSSVRPTSLAKWAMAMKKYGEDIREMMDWTLEKGTRPEERETRRAIKKFRNYLNLDWLRLQKELKGREGITWFDCEEMEDKRKVAEMTQYYTKIFTDFEDHPIFKRLCYFCHNH